MESMRQCGVCKRLLPETAEYFHRRGSGFQSACKSCRREQKRAWRKANPEKRREERKRYREAHPDREAKRRRAWRDKNAEHESERRRKYRLKNIVRFLEAERAYRENNRAKRNAARRVYTATHLEQERERSKAYKQGHVEEVKASGKKYRGAHRLRIRLVEHNRRARLKSAEGKYTVEDLDKQFRSQKGRCYYCGKEVGDAWHPDHVVPISRGGSNFPDNIVISCPQCNMRKNDKLPHEWAEGGRLL